MQPSMCQNTCTRTRTIIFDLTCQSAVRGPVLRALTMSIDSTFVCTHPSFIPAIDHTHIRTNPHCALRLQHHLDYSTLVFTAYTHTHKHTKTQASGHGAVANAVQHTICKSNTNVEASEFIN